MYFLVALIATELPFLLGIDQVGAGLRKYLLYSPANFALGVVYSGIRRYTQMQRQDRFPSLPRLGPGWHALQRMNRYCPRSWEAARPCARCIA